MQVESSARERPINHRVALGSVLISLLIAGALLCCSCSRDGLAVGGNWTVAQGTARLSELWYQAQHELDVDLSGAGLTSFMGRWTADGKIRDVILHALTPAGPELTIQAMTDSTNGRLTVHAQLVDWWGEANGSGPVVSADPPAADVLASIDAVGVGHICEAASVRAAGGERLQLVLIRGFWIGDTMSDVTIGDVFLPRPNSRGPHYFSVKSGAIVALEGSNLLSSVVPAEAFIFMKEDPGFGVTQEESSANVYLFVR